jgi:serine/threonine protein kinase
MLLSGERPFYANTRRELGRMIRHDPLRFPSPRWDRISPDAQVPHDDRTSPPLAHTSSLTSPGPRSRPILLAAQDFCQSLMQKKPALRLAASAAKDHPWIKARRSR